MTDGPVTQDLRAADSEELSFAAIYTLPVGLAFVEAPSGRVLFANEAARRLACLSSDDLGRLEDPSVAVYQEDGRRIPPEDWPVRRSMLTGEVIAGRVVEIRRGRESFYVRVGSAPVRDEASAIVAAVVTLDDVTGEWQAFRTEQRLRRGWEGSANRMGRLQLMSVAMAGALSATDAARALAREARAALGAGGTAVWLVDGDWLEIAAADGYAGDFLRPYRRIPHDDRLPVCDAIRTGMPVVLPTRAARASAYPQIGPGTDTRFKAWAAVPLLVDDRAIGAVALSFYEEHRFDEGEEGFLIALGAQSAQAIERARLFEREREARDRFRFLADASVALASSLEHEGTLQSVARLAVPIFADWCAVDLIDGNGRLNRVAFHHRDPAKVRVTVELAQRYAPSADILGSVDRVMRAGRADWASYVPDDMLQRAAVDGTHLALLRELNLTSYVIVPLRGREQVRGAILFAMGESQRRYRQDDVGLAEEIAARAAIALDNAELYRIAKENEQRADSAYARAKLAERRKDEFLAVLGHELRNPLAPIATALELMELKSDHATTKERAIIRRQVDHLSRLVDDLLDLSRITRGKVELRRKRVELGALVGRALELASPLLERKRHELVIDVPESGLSVRVDETRMAQVIANLLTNAAKYTGHGGRIEVRARAEADTITLSVKDNGIGISADAMPTIFEAFVQGPRAVDGGRGGLGVGLALVKSLVALHKGSVEAHSPGVGRGSEFTVRLPRHGRSSQSSQSMRAVRLDAAQELAGARPRRVLVVDDNEDAAQLLAEVLTEGGHHVRVARDGPSALQAAATFRPEVALLDIGLPVMDGYELGARLREQLGPAAPLLVAVTGYGQDSDRRRSLDQGFFEHLVKPVSVDVLKQLLVSLPE